MYNIWCTHLNRKAEGFFSWGNTYLYAVMFDLEQIAMLWSNRKEDTWIGD